MKLVPRGYKHSLIQSLNQLVVSLSDIINEHKQNPKREKRFFFHWTPGSEKKIDNFNYLNQASSPWQFERAFMANPQACGQ